MMTLITYIHEDSVRVGNCFKPPGLNHGLNRLKLNEFMPLAGINSILPGLNRFKPPAGINQFKPLAGTNSISAGFFSNPGFSLRLNNCIEMSRPQT